MNKKLPDHAYGAYNLAENLTEEGEGKAHIKITHPVQRWLRLNWRITYKKKVETGRKASRK